MRPPIGLADLVRAVARMAPQGDDPDEIVRVLRLAVAATARIAPVPPPASEQPATIVLTAGVPRPQTFGAPPRPARTAEAPGRAPLRGQISLRPLGRRERGQPAWLTGDGQRLELGRPSAAAAPPRIETLFEPRRHRALIGAAIATFDPRGPLDLDRLIERLATRRLEGRLPRRPVLSLASGGWLLLDRSAAMAPFQDDADDLAARIERVVGRERVRRQQFLAEPALVWDAERLEDRAIVLPPPGTPLVVLTDLAARSGGRGWRPLLERLAARRCPVVAFVPYPAARWPRELRGRVTIVPWDRATRVRSVKPHRRGGR